MDLAKIKEIQRRNREAMEAENAAKAAAKAEEEKRQAEWNAKAPEREEAFHAMMVDMVNTVFACPGRPLPSSTVRKLNAIRQRHSR